MASIGFTWLCHDIGRYRALHRGAAQSAREAHTLGDLINPGVNYLKVVNRFKLLPK